jgi:Patatin-like phospholipase
MAVFKIGINMAGAISAGAYTAGVLDFLTEALDEWYAAKQERKPVPMHDVSIEVFSGASAGGMCAAISAVMLQENFEHIHDTTKRDTTNRFYESWVNKIDIKELLQVEDLKNTRSVVSLLDSTVIREIAKYALAPCSSRVTRPYVSSDLNLFLSLTNLRGVPYSLNAAAPGSIEETTFFYGDRIRFQTTSSGTGALLKGSTRTLDLLTPGEKGGWAVLQAAAISTGAFPVFLAPGTLERSACEYVPPHWESVTSAISDTPPPITPNFPKNFPESFPTLNVDGGVTNNDPFNYAHDFLGSLSPTLTQEQRLGKPSHVDRAVITIAPFPTTEPFDPEFDPTENASILCALPKLVSALISQSRFFGESLSEVMSGTTFDRFIVAPSDSDLIREHLNTGAPGPPPALQCAALGAFGGFFEREFRAHDYALGRRNCQKFLKDSFVLPADNPTIKAGLECMDTETRAIVTRKYGCSAPGTYAQSAADLQRNQVALPEAQREGGDLWIPIIPLCTDRVSEEIPRVNRARITRENLDTIVTLLLRRYKALAPYIIHLVPSWPFRQFLRLGQPFIRTLARKPLTAALRRRLGDSYQR